MKGKFYILIAFLVFAFAGSAAAHPLGNFSINHYSRIEIEKTQIQIRAVLDMAEIPTFQESRTIDADGDGSLSQIELDAYAEKITPLYVSNLLLSIDGVPAAVRPFARNVTLPEGSGNLPTLRIEWDLIADLPNSANPIQIVRFENKNNAGRIGWNEIVVNHISAVKVFDSSAFGSGITDELKTYPEETLSAPLAERTAEFSVTSDELPVGARVLQNRDGHTSAPVEKDKFAELIAVREITPTIILFGLLVAFGLGAMHALSPGHGKAVVGAYLVGSRGTAKHALFLGATVTITHTLGVFALGFLTLFASSYILPERLMPYLTFVSGLLVFYIGLMLFKDRLMPFLGYKPVPHQDHSHDYSENTQDRFHANDHSHSHGEHSHQHSDDGLTHTHGGSTHTHIPPEKVTWRNLLALGVSGGLLPCPSALVLMLSAISLNRIGYGIILTLFFSLGLAATLTCVGLVFLYVGKFFNNSALSENRIIKTLPVFSAFVIACVGAVICYQSLV